MHEVLGHQLITDCLPRARLIDEHESIHAIVLFVGKAIGRGQAAKGRGHGRMARRELIEFCRLGSIWWTRGQRQQQIAKDLAVGYRKNLDEFITMSVSPPSGRWYLMAMPCGLALGEPSGIFGTPVELENRTVTGIGLPLNNTARLSPSASGAPVKWPSATMPLA